MKKLTVKKNSECMACLQCVQACSEAFYKEFDEDLSCIRIVAKGNAAKPNVCIQYMINKKKCVSCGKCVEICPMKVMVLKEGNPASKCIACGICAKACPMEILEIVEK